MTVPAKYSLTEAHFIIVELERELEALHGHASAMANQVDELAKQRVEANALIQGLRCDLRDERNDCVQDQAYIRRLKKLLVDAYPYVEKGLMAAAHQTYHDSQQELLDRYRKAIGK